MRQSLGMGNVHCVTLYNALCPPPPPPPFSCPRAKLQNKLLYSASIGGGARRAKPQSPHMYQAVRDPLSNLHFNACLSSIITSGTAWLNFTDAHPSTRTPLTLSVSLCLSAGGPPPFDHQVACPFLTLPAVSLSLFILLHLRLSLSPNLGCRSWL